MNDYSNCDRTVATGLIEILMSGINQGKLAEADAVLAALRVLRPRFRELDTFDAWLFIKRKQYIEATRVLRTLHSGSELRNLPICTALHACCLYASGDPAWRISANEVLERDEDPDAVALVNLMLGKPAEDEEEAAPEAPVMAEASAHSYYLRA
ncbi:MAG TPA: HrpB1 family type III secretion system apparatus protein [Duganella sp.]|uniref:HrpB1 family type III secretion system apparatus protein n=1 Tax=Duganella sp. TaxID=1904440 RepID=UPI002ED408D0